MKYKSDESSKLPTKKSIIIKDNRTIDMVTKKPMTDRNRMHSKIDPDYVQKIITSAKKYGIDPYTALAVGLQETGYDSNWSTNPFHLNDWSEAVGIKYNEKEGNKFKNVINNLSQSKRDLVNYTKGYTGENVISVDQRGSIERSNNVGLSPEAYPELKKTKYFKNYIKADSIFNIENEKRFKEGLKENEIVQERSKEPIDVSLNYMKKKFDNAKKIGKVTDEDIIQSWNGYGKLNNTHYKNYGINDSIIDMSKTPVYGQRIVNLRDSVIKKDPTIVKMVNGLKANGGKINTMKYTSNRYGAYPRRDWGGALTGASSGFKMGSSIGMMFGPVGGAIAGGVGAITGALFGNASENKRDREQRRQDSMIAKLKSDEKIRTEGLQKKQLKQNDTNYLSNFNMNNQSGLFMKRGGRIMQGGGKVEPWHKKLADKQINEYRKNASQLDSLSSNILTPALLKKYNLKDPSQITTDHSLNQKEIDSLLSKNEGSKMYKGNLDFFSKYLNYKKYNELTGDVNDVTGTNEQPSDTMADKRFGKRVNAFANNIPNITIPVTESINGGKPKVIKNYKIYEPTENVPKYMKSNGGKVVSNGKMLTGGNKLLTKNGSTTGSHESGANIPIKRNNKTVAIAEPGEVLVNDKDITSTPFVLSKRLGFAQKFMKLEGIKNTHNANIIEDRQSKLVTMNNRLVSKGKYAAGGLPIPKFNNVSFNLPKATLQSYKGTKGNGSRAGSIFGDMQTNFKGLDMNTIVGAAGTVGNLLMTNKTLKRQKGLINNSLNEALAYTPTLNKNYLLNDNVDINDQVSGINQGYNSSVSGLDGIDPAIASALKTSAGMSRSRSLGSVFANRNNVSTGIRNQNTMNIMSNNSSNNSLLNQTALMKLNAKISANESLGDAESARLGNVQGALSEFNTILRDKDIMKSLDARWKDSIGKDYTGKTYGCGGRIGKKRKHAMAR